tara:strand:+ start:203 stop:736 length:534 start_codon:yes stop_codon:yes gene_type:complete
MHRALFLDRDGIINIDLKYVGKIENFVFEKGIFDLVKSANFFSYKVIVVTNQSGIGRGFYSEKDFLLLTKWMKEQFALNNGFIDKVYFCPHHPKFGINKYKKKCNCRKPNPGMILKACEEFDLCLKESVFLGDNITDMQAGISAGVGTLLLKNKTKYSECINISNNLEAIKYLRNFT